MGKRSRNMAHMWCDKRIPRFFQKWADGEWENLGKISPAEYHRMILMNETICRIDSDFCESKTITSIQDLAIEYSRSGVNTVSAYLQFFRKLGYIEYGKKRCRHSTCFTKGSYLNILEYDEDLFLENAMEALIELRKRMSKMSLNISSEDSRKKITTLNISSEDSSIYRENINSNIPKNNNQQFKNSIPIQQTTPNSIPIQTTQNIPSSKRTIIPVAPPPAAVVDPLAADKDLALQLANIVRSQKHIKIDTQTINQWAKVIAKGRKKLGLNAARVKRVLDWYPSHLEIESKYKYIAYCGSSLIEKFIKLEDCMLRDKPKTQSQPEPEPEYTSSHSQVIPDTMKKITHEELMARWEREEEEEDEYLRSLYLPQEKKSDAKLFEELKMMNEMSEEELERIYGNGGDCDDN